MSEMINKKEVTALLNRVANKLESRGIEPSGDIEKLRTLADQAGDIEKLRVLAHQLEELWELKK